MNDHGLDRQFLETVDYIVDSNDCWLWNHTIGDDGYGHIRTIWCTMTIHRYMHLQKFNIAPTDPRHTDHKCRVRKCINPDHTQMLSIAENVLSGEGITAQNKRKENCKCGRTFKLRNRIGRPPSRYCPVCQYEKRKVK